MKKTKKKSLWVFVAFLALDIILTLPILIGCVSQMDIFDKETKESETVEAVSTLEMTKNEDGSITITGKNGATATDFEIYNAELEVGRYTFVTGLEEVGDYCFYLEDIANGGEYVYPDNFYINYSGSYPFHIVIAPNAEVDLTFTPSIETVSSYEYLRNRISNADTNAVISLSDEIDLSEPITIDKSLTLELSSVSNASFTLVNGANLTLKGDYDGITVSGVGVLSLNDVSVTATVVDTNGLTIAPDSDITLNIEGDVQIVGAIGGDGIEIPETSVLTLTGDNLTVVGNNGEEYSTLVGYGTTNNTDYEGKFGSGIGNAQNNIGKIHITNLNSLIAEGYGTKAFGIGGGDGSTIVIDNTRIQYARGGFPSNVFTTGNLYGKTEAEGGCAIGVGSGAAINYEIGSVVLDTVIIDNAEGGSKSAGIGAMYWNGVDIEIKNSILRNIVGGNCSAAIGGARVHKTQPCDQTLNIVISDSTVVATGGEYAAGIGSGYNTYCSQEFQVVNIEITGDSYIQATGGKNGAGIGTGHHNGGLTGFIDSSVLVSAIAGEAYLYETGDISAPQNIGYGMCYTSSDRELANATVTFTVAGEVIAHPSENLVSTATAE